MKATQALAIVETYRNYGSDSEVEHTEYSGRGMYGKTTHAVIIDEDEDVGGVVNALTDAIRDGVTSMSVNVPEDVTLMDNEDPENVDLLDCIDALTRASSDTLGYRSIHY